MLHKYHVRYSVQYYLWFHVTVVGRPVFTHRPQGPGPRVANFQGRHIKKIEIEVWYAEKWLSMREKFKGDLY
jgi:hypothetical protein